MTTSQRLPDRAELTAVLDLVREEALQYLERVDTERVRQPNADAAARAFDGELPETGEGATAALRELVDRGLEAAICSSGPRFFHFVIGGATPAAFGADWLTTLLDQLASAWVTSPLAVQLELTSLRWLREIFGIGPATGVMTTGAMMSNFTCLAAARQWWGERHGIDVAQQGLAGAPPLRVISSGYLHATSYKTLAMLGIGRDAVELHASDDAGRVDLDAMERALRDQGGAPAILIANAGEVNAGDFDPITSFADLAERYGAWLHVDGAFGLFAAAAPEAAHLVAGVERAHSVTVDGHKWLNVPYDCGFAFVRDGHLLGKTFRLVADYLPDPDDPEPSLSSVGPESSRRGRALSVWATLRAYGRTGVRRMVEGHLRLARRLAAAVDDAPDLDRLADVGLNIVCFRYDPGGLSEAELDRRNEALGRAILRDGRVYLGTTRYCGKVALRPAIVNWRTRESDIDYMVAVVRELAGAL